MLSEHFSKEFLFTHPEFSFQYLGSIGRVTRSHFSRLLSTMKLDVSDNDLHILFKKFEDRKMAKVNYMEFIRTIDPESKPRG